MAEHSFTSWLNMEVVSAEYALLAIFEERDRLQFTEAPALEKEYMDKVGNFEETVIKAEIECELLQKKKQMIQTSINRQEPIDEEAIDAKIDEMRQQMLEEAAGSGSEHEYTELSPERSNELQELYHEIVRNFHPQTHPELTEIHRQLYQKAQDAYRRRDLEALRLIYDMLTADKEETYATISAGISVTSGDEETENALEHLKEDYSLAKELFSNFCASEDDIILKQQLEKYRAALDSAMAEVEEIRSSFPFTAADMLSDPDKTAAYMEELTHRLRTAEAECERLRNEIKIMIESVDIHG